MKQSDLVKLLRKNGCCIQRDTGPHTVWINPKTNALTTVPRHKEIKKNTAKSICRALGIDTDGVSFA